MTNLILKSKIKGLKATLKKSEPPELCYRPIADGVQGNFKLPRECTWCPHKIECHAESNMMDEDLRIYNYARGPVFFTDLVVEPRVQEITNEWKEKLNLFVEQAEKIQVQWINSLLT